MNWRRYKFPPYRLDLLAFGLSIGFFLALPNADLEISLLFYDAASNSFPANDLWFVNWIYQVFAEIHIPIIAGLLTMIWLNRKNRNCNEVTAKRRYTYLLCALLVGPGAITHLILKDNSFERPRPRQTIEFSGEHNYSPPFVFSGACARNCSFVSGHAAVAFWFILIGWAFNRPWWHFFGFLLGLLVGGFRVLQGAHFLSDIVFAFWVVYGVGIILKITYLETAKSR